MNHRKGFAVRIVLVLFILGMFLSAQHAMAAGSTADTNMVSIIVKLDVQPLASYSGGISGLTGTSAASRGSSGIDLTAPESRTYSSYLHKKMDTFRAAALKAIPGASLVHRYDVVFGGVSMIVPADKVPEVRQLPGVTNVYADSLKQINTDRSPGFIGATTLWTGLGGVHSAGEGIIVGVIDTGIWPEHPSFSNPDPYGRSYPAPPSKWKGYCETPLDGSAPITCNNKLIGARELMDAYKAQQGGMAPGEFDSARDSDGHGTHTASTAAGNARVQAVVLDNNIGYISGIAPRAHVAMYRACGVKGCYGSDLVAAINQAVADGVDVINYSIGPSEFLTDPYSSPDDMAFLDAYAAGVFVACSAGNSGPGLNTVDHLGGWTTTVGASTTDRSFTNRLTLKASTRTLKLNGTSITTGVTSYTPVVLARDYGDALCQYGFAEGTFQGQIVVCERGVNARVAKGYNVMTGGGSGMVLYNPSFQDTATDNHWLPAIHLEDDAGSSLLGFFDSYTGIQGQLTAGKKSRTKGDVLGIFTSRGGPGQTYGISKPDLVAPGVQILAGMTAEPLSTDSGPSGQLFQVIQGTSMASPHVAGAGALLKQIYPGWTPGMIKSALMTTCVTDKVYLEDKTTLAGSYERGSGRINLARVRYPGLTFDAPAQDYITYKDSLWNVNYPSIYIPNMGDTITVQRTAGGTLGMTTTWTVSVESGSGLEIAVPATITVPAGGTSTFNISIDATAVPAGASRQTMITLKRGTVRVQLPVTIVKGTP